MKAIIRAESELVGEMPAYVEDSFSVLVERTSGTPDDERSWLEIFIVDG